MNIVIPIASQQKGFFISLGKELATRHVVRFVPYDRDVSNLIRRLAPELSDNMIIQRDFEIKINDDVLEQAKRIEETYDIRISWLISQDRALGKGYLFNADCYPEVIRSWWSHEQKIAEILKDFFFSEYIFDSLSPDVIIAIQKNLTLFTIAKSRGVPFYSLAPVKYGYRYLLSDNEFLTNELFIKKVKEYASVGDMGQEELGNYEQEAGSKYNQSRAAYTWLQIMKNVSHQFFEEFKRLVRGSRKKNGYLLFGWIPPLIRRKFTYEYFRKHGKRPDELKSYRLAYVALHLEPEISLQGISPEFNNSMEMISWVSKSVPCEVMIVVKEQPFSFGIRSKKYYDMLRRIGNVVLAHPETKSWSWIESSALVVAITGTVGTEAVNFKRPVLSFGAHQAINHLPTVRFADNYASTRRGVDELLALTSDDPLFSKAKWALRKAQLECSINLYGFEKSYKSDHEEPKLAQKLAKGLYTFFPNVFDGNREM